MLGDQTVANQCMHTSTALQQVPSTSTLTAAPRRQRAAAPARPRHAATSRQVAGAWHPAHLPAPAVKMKGRVQSWDQQTTASQRSLKPTNCAHASSARHGSSAASITDEQLVCLSLIVSTHSPVRLPGWLPCQAPGRRLIAAAPAPGASRRRRKRPRCLRPPPLQQAV